MTERKPQGMSFTSWIDQQIIDAEKRGLFDNLPGAGKPIRIPKDEDYGQAWVRDYARREGVPPEELLPTPLRLRKEIEQLTEAIQDLRSEQEIRDAVADLNRQIMDWRRISLGPPIFVPLMNEEELIGRWRDRQSVKRPASSPADVSRETDAGRATGADRPARAGRQTPGTEPPGPGWWRRLTRRGRRLVAADQRPGASSPRRRCSITRQRSST